MSAFKVTLTRSSAVQTLYDCHICGHNDEHNTLNYFIITLNYFIISLRDIIYTFADFDKNISVV